MGNPTDRAQEHFPARLGYGMVEVKKIKRVEGRPNEEITETFTGFLANSRLVAREGESNEITELYLSFRDNGDTPSLYKLIQIKIGSLREKAKDGVALTDDEVKEINDLISWCPGGKDSLSWQAELRGVAEEQILGKGTGIINDDEVTRAFLDWDTLRQRDLKYNDQEAKKAAEEVERSNGFIADLYLICSAHGIDPKTLRISDFLRERLVNEGKQELLRQLIGEEDGRSGGRRLERGLTERWVINPVEYWNRQLLSAVELRLEAMRSQTTTKLAKDGKRMEIVRSVGDKLLRRTRLASRLSFEMLDPGSELGKFLNRFGVLDYWRGKAAIDRMWSLYTGIPIESAKVRAARPAGEGLFNVLTKDNVNAAEVNECCGPEAELQISKDDKTCDALNILYHLAEGKTYQESLLELKEFFLKKYKVDIDLNKNLPIFVKDAVMIAYFYGLDIRANGKKDARYKSWLVGEHENIGWVTDVDGNRINLLGDAFALKPDDMVERGWFSGRNASLAYNAISGDPTEYNPNIYSYQKTAKWQNVFFYTLGLDRDNGRVRHYDVDPNVPDDNILPGTMGKFEGFDNNNQDHRRALFDRLAWVAKEELSENKPSWDSDLRAKVDKVLKFFTNADPNNSNPFGTNNEVWFDPRIMSGLSIWEDLNLVLEDPRAWGLIGDFRDSEMQHRTQNTRYTQHNSFLYDCAAVESAGLLVKILKKIPNTLPEEMGIFPAQILEAAQDMRHRYNSELTFRNLNTLLTTTSLLAIKMFLQVQIPSREMVQKMLGEYKLFEWKRIFEGVKGLPINGTIQRSAGIEFFLRQIEQELDITETGIVGRFDDAIKMMVGILVVTEAFDWATQRDLFMNKRAFVYQYLSSWLNPGRPVEGYRVPVAITQPDGSIKIRQLCVSDLTYREVFGFHQNDEEYLEYMRGLKKDRNYNVPDGQDIEEFFTPMTKDEIGKAYGGSLAAKISVPAGGFAKGANVYILDQGSGQAVVYGKNAAGEVVRETIEVNNLQITNHEVNGWQRPGETMLEGGRAVYRSGGWEWVKGKWEFEREAGSRFKFASGEGYSRVWDEVKGKMSDHEAWVKRAVVEKTKEVRLPCLKMTEEQAQKYFLHRYQILFELLTGRAREGNKSGQALIDLDPYYETDTAFISKLIRPIKELELAVNLVQQKQALRGIVMKGEHLSYEFMMVSKWAREAYAVSKMKEFEGNMEHGQQQQVIEASDVIRREETKILGLNWWEKAALLVNQFLVWKKISAPAAVVTGVFAWGLDLVVGKPVIPLISNLMRVAHAPDIVATVLPYFVVYPLLYGLGLLAWDNWAMLPIIRLINNAKAPNFGHFFSKYFDPTKNKEDAYFPAQ